MFCFCVLLLITFVYVTCDLNYFLRTLFTVWSGRLYESRCSLDDVTVIYGMCTFQECELSLKGMRLDRLIRDIDFGKYHFYDRTGIYKRSRQLGIHSLQGSTLTLHEDTVPLLVPYKINTKLVFWDERSLFFEHEVITLHDQKLRYLLVSRQYAIGKKKECVQDLIEGLPGSDCKHECPIYITHWLQSMQLSSQNIPKI